MKIEKPVLGRPFLGPAKKKNGPPNLKKIVGI